jgi:GDP-L-fucose synthase
VVAGILSRTHQAKINGKSELVVWGDGSPRRELLYVDDLAEAMKCVMHSSIDNDLYNIGCGHDIAISELAGIIAKVVGFEGKIVYDTTKPNGTMRKLLNTSLIRSLGWNAKVGEEAGLRAAYQDFLSRSTQ